MMVASAIKLLTADHAGTSLREVYETAIEYGMSFLCSRFFFHKAPIVIRSSFDSDKILT